MIQKPGYLLDDQSGDSKKAPIETIESAKRVPFDDSAQSCTDYYDDMYAHEKFFMNDTERLDYFKKCIIFNSL